MQFKTGTLDNEKEENDDNDDRIENWENVGMTRETRGVTNCGSGNFLRRPCRRRNKVRTTFGSAASCVRERHSAF